MIIKKLVKVTCKETDCFYNKKKSCTGKKVIIKVGASCKNMIFKEGE